MRIDCSRMALPGHFDITSEKLTPFLWKAKQLKIYFTYACEVAVYERVHGQHTVSSHQTLFFVILCILLQSSVTRLFAWSSHALASTRTDHLKRDCPFFSRFCCRWLIRQFLDLVLFLKMGVLLMPGLMFMQSMEAYLWLRGHGLNWEWVEGWKFNWMWACFFFFFLQSKSGIPFAVNVNWMIRVVFHYNQTEWCGCFLYFPTKHDQKTDYPNEKQLR